VFFINLPTVKLMHDTTYLAMTYWKRVHTFLDTSEGTVVFVHPSDSFSIFIINCENASTQKNVDLKNAVKRKSIDRTEEANKFW